MKLGLSRLFKQFGGFSRTTSTMQPLHHCCPEGSHHWEDSSYKPGGMYMFYQQLCNNGFNWMVDIWSMYSSDPLNVFGSCLRLNPYRSKILSLYLSIRVIFIIISYVVFDLSLIILVQKLWNTLHILISILYIYIYIYNIYIYIYIYIYINVAIILII